MKENDIVIAIQPINEIVINSVGIIKSIIQEGAHVHFVGDNKDVVAPVDSLQVIDSEKTGDQYQYKICNVCHIRKLVEEFEKNQRNSKGEVRRRPSCKICRTRIDGEKIKHAEKKRMNAERLPSKTVFECPICSKRTIIDVTARIVADHDHDTGMGREWICDSCNTGLGRFKDDVKILKVAIEYLESFEGDESEEVDSPHQVSLFEA